MNRTIRTWVEISLNNLEHNYHEICSRLPEGCQMLGICKANSYGHGAVRVAQRLQQAGCHWVAVNCYDEAEELRAAGVKTPMLILSYTRTSRWTWRIWTRRRRSGRSLTRRS